ncbi:carboxypeptidase regulatory-like domain-containing protein [Cystobacter fuscus]
MSGALVVALAPPSSEWHSVRETPERSEDMCPQSPDAQRLLEWVEAHRHEALPLAHATTDAQGRFLLEGLSRGPFVLWAESGVLIGLREGVSAGAQEQDVRVEPRERISGKVRDEQRRPLAGVRVTVLVRAAGRVVETVTGEDGRFAFGPLPDPEPPLLLSKEGFLSVSHSSSQGKSWWEGREMTLYAAHRLSGQVMDERGPVPGATVQREGSPGHDRRDHGCAGLLRTRGRMSVGALRAGRASGRADRPAVGGRGAGAGARAGGTRPRSRGAVERAGHRHVGPRSRGGRGDRVQ